MKISAAQSSAHELYKFLAEECNPDIVGQVLARCDAIYGISRRSFRSIVLEAFLTEWLGKPAAKIICNLVKSAQD